MSAGRLPPLPQGFTATAIGCDLYICGGEYELGHNTWFNDVWRYDGITQCWHKVHRLPAPRRHHSAVSWGDDLYLIGGFGRYRVLLDNVQRLNINTGEWSDMPPLLEPTFMAAATLCRDRIYVIKNHMEYLSRDAKQWTRIEANLPFQLGIRYAATIGRNLCLSMVGKIIIFSPEPCYVIDTHVVQNRKCAQIAVCNGAVYLLFNDNQDSSHILGQQLSLERWQPDSEKTERDTIIMLPLPHLHLSSIHTMPALPQPR